MADSRGLFPSVRKLARRWVKDERRRSVVGLETLFFEICTALSPDLFIEAGAKDASSSRRARAYLPKARIVAFEANPHTYRRFHRNPDNAAKDVRYLNLALSDADGPVTFNVRVIKGKPSADGQNSLLVRQDSRVDNLEVTVEATRLDRHFPSDTFDSAALWVDVEGANRQVLMGATGILHKAAVIFIEVEDKSFWNGQWLAKDVLKYLGEHDLVEVARDHQSRHQYNSLLIRRDLLDSDRVSPLLRRHRRTARQIIGSWLWKLE